MLVSVNRHGTVKMFSHALRVNWLRAWIGRSFMFAVSVVIDTKARGNLNIEATTPPKGLSSIWILCLMICFLRKLLLVQNKFGRDECKLDAATLLILAPKHLFSESHIHKPRFKVKTPTILSFLLNYISFKQAQKPNYLVPRGKSYWHMHIPYRPPPGLTK